VTPKKKAYLRHTISGSKMGFQDSNKPSLSAVHSQYLIVYLVRPLPLPIPDCLRLEALYFEDFKNQHQYDLFADKRMIPDKLEGEGIFSVQDGHPSPTPTGIAVADSLSLI